MTVTINGSTGFSGSVTPADGSISTAKLADAAVTPAKFSQPATLITPVSLSGGYVDFTGIPSWVRRVTVLFNAMSTAGNVNIVLQLGTASGIVNSGYTSASTYLHGGTASGGYTATNGLALLDGSAANALSGSVVINLMVSNTWVSSGVWIYDNAPNHNGYQAGKVTLPSALTFVRIAPATPDTFDAGTATIFYE